MKHANILERLNNLSAKQRKLLAQQIGTNANEDKSNAGADHQRLTAYVVATNQLDVAKLVYYLKNKLPDYMVPANVVQLDEMPRLPNGKIDLNNLPIIDKTPTWNGSEFVAPNTPIEKKLAEIWEQVLDFEPVGIHDNFFEIGGDSILSIQVVAKARKAGIQLAANQLFEHQTISELALFAKEKQEEKIIEKELFVGPVPLLPIQHWFFEEHVNAPSHWNQTMLLELPDFFNNRMCGSAMQYLIHRHEAFRLNFSKKENQWEASILAPEKIAAFQFFDLSKLPNVEQDKSILEISNKTNTGFNLENGSLFRAIYFDKGNTQKNQLLLVAHHLVVDNVSWQLILNDLETIARQLNNGATISLPAIQFTYKSWSDHLMDISNSKKIKTEQEFWEAQEKGLTHLPTDFDFSLPVEEDSIHTLNIGLDNAITNELLNDAHAAYNTRTDELLIAALSKTINGWVGKNNLTLGLERHGRESLENEIDPSEIIGWMTSYFPVHFQLENTEETSQLIKSVKEQLRQVPNGGIGYGLSRYLNKNNAKQFAQKPSIIFNYLGNHSQDSSGFFGDIKTISHGARSPQSERFHLLEINAFIFDGQLQINWGYSEKGHKGETIILLAKEFENNLRAIIKHCKDPLSGSYTPSDFSEAGLSQDDLDHLMGNLEF